MKQQIIRFLIVGGVSTLLNYFVFIAILYLDRSLYMFASCSGYMAGVLLGFYANRNWTFGSGDSQEKFLFRYIQVYSLSLLLSLGILYILVDILGVWPEAANLIVIVFSTVSNFIGTKLYVFRQ